MVKYFCDCCDKEITSGNGHNKFEYKCHLEPGTSTFDCHVDGEHNRVSGRYNSKLLCARCYNEVMTSALDRFVGLRANR